MQLSRSKCSRLPSPRVQRPTASCTAPLFSIPGSGSHPSPASSLCCSLVARWLCWGPQMAGWSFISGWLPGSAPGIELLQYRVQVAQQVATAQAGQYSERLQLEMGDAAATEVAGAAVVYLTSLAWGAELVDQVHRRLARELSDDALVVANDWLAKADPEVKALFELVQEVRLPVSWGEEETFVIYRKRRTTAGGSVVGNEYASMVHRMIMRLLPPLPTTGSPEAVLHMLHDVLQGDALVHLALHHTQQKATDKIVARVGDRMRSHVEAAKPVTRTTRDAVWKQICQTDMEEYFQQLHRMMRLIEEVNSMPGLQATIQAAQIGPTLEKAYAQYEEAVNSSEEAQACYGHLKDTGLLDKEGANSYEGTFRLHAVLIKLKGMGVQQ